MIIPSRRRFFLLGAAALAAPAIAKASNLMPISVLRPPKLWGDGIHDDAEALQWMIDNAAPEGSVAIPRARYLIGNTLTVRPGHAHVDIIDSEFIAAPSLQSYMFDLKKGASWSVEHCIIRGARGDYRVSPPPTIITPPLASDTPHLSP